MNDLEKAIAAYRWLVTLRGEGPEHGPTAARLSGIRWLDFYLAMAKTARPEFVEAFNRGWVSVLSDTEN